ncbi:MAG: Uma2 family endonuclease [Syntrophobacteraceae bacterium]|nr:Uma2 family endonuclease [Syntrophobacteraceae bacterium]
MEWEEVVKDPSLKDLPFKIEMNEWGKIMMAPTSDLHGLYQGRIVKVLGNLAKEGEISTECAVQTAKGVRVIVADVAWRSSAFLKKHGIRNLKLPESPEVVVVEIESSSNTAAELEEKRLIYFEVGAREFWLCDEDGNMRFFNPQGELKRSEFFGEFPEHIEIDIAQ